MAYASSGTWGTRPTRRSRWSQWWQTGGRDKQDIQIELFQSTKSVHHVKFSQSRNHVRVKQTVSEWQNYHGVQAQSQQHEEENDGPERREWQSGQGLWIHHEGNAWTWHTCDIQWLLIVTDVCWWKKRLCTLLLLLLLLFGAVLPSSATFSIGTLSSCAMKPMTEKITKPANILVALLVHVTMMVSLQGRKAKDGNRRLKRRNFFTLSKLDKAAFKHV